jgi:hypothetical protein
VNVNDQKLAKTGENANHSIRARLSRWAHHTLKLLEPGPDEGYEIYMRCPGERVPSPPQRGRPRWHKRQDDWVLAA